MSDIILEIEHLSKSFERNRVLDDINLSLKKASVLALMGENGAGKSTMMKCLFSILAKDEGRFLFQGKPVNFRTPKAALENGVAMVHQELNQSLDRSVADNLYLGRYPTKFGIVDEAKMFEDCISLFKSLNMSINPHEKLRNLSVSQRQMLEIVKALSYHAKIIVLDEPTSSLTENEVQRLFEIIRTLKGQGVSFIYISHKMDEIFQICDQIAVLRDGKMVMQKDTCDTNMDEVITAMVGRTLEKRFPDMKNTPGELALSIENLSTKFKPMLDNISFKVRKGEIFGLYGLVGAGRSELLESIFGIRSITTGTISYNGKKMHFSNAREALDEGFALVTEERKFNGIFPENSITFNTTIANLEGYYRIKGVVSERKMTRAAIKKIQQMQTKCSSPEELISSLSGGNQQKVIIGKWLERSPKVLLLDEPTRGIDVFAKYEIYQLISKLAQEGKIVIVSSSEMPELLGITNRIAVLSNHKLAGIVETKQTTQEELLRLAALYL